MTPFRLENKQKIFVAAAAIAFFFANARQERGLTGLTPYGAPEHHFQED